MVILIFQSKVLPDWNRARSTQLHEIRRQSVQPRDLRRAIREDRSNSFWCESGRRAPNSSLSLTHSAIGSLVRDIITGGLQSIHAPRGENHHRRNTHTNTLTRKHSLGVRSDGVTGTGEGWAPANNCRTRMKNKTGAKLHLSHAFYHEFYTWAVCAWWSALLSGCKS